VSGVLFQVGAKKRFKYGNPDGRFAFRANKRPLVNCVHVAAAAAALASFEVILYSVYCPPKTIFDSSRRVAAGGGGKRSGG
jgi:hypothetical protein